MALTLAVGFVVDDAIVMLENIVRHMEMGKPPLRAAFDGSREVGFTILSMTISLVAVFIPILFLGGIIGRLFHEFAVVIAVSILMSGVGSLTLTAMLSSRTLRAQAHESHGRMYNATERAWDSVVGLYGPTLLWVMEHRRATMAFSLAVLVGTGVLFVLVPKGFIPSQDNGSLSITTEAAQGTSFQDMIAHQREVASIVQQDPNIAGFMSAVGGGGGANQSLNQGRLFISLKPRGERKGVDDIIADLRPKLSRVPGIIVFMQNPPAIQIGGRVGKSQFQFTIQSSDHAPPHPPPPTFNDATRKATPAPDGTSGPQL